MKVKELQERIKSLDITPAMLTIQCPDVSPSQASKWLKQINSTEREPTKICYWFFLFLCDRLSSEVSASKEYHKSLQGEKASQRVPEVVLETTSVKVDSSKMDKAKLEEIVAASFKPIVNTFPQQGDEDDIDLDHENMNTLDYECLSEHLPYVLAPEGKFLKQGGGVVFTHNNRGYKATPSQESPSVVFFEGQEKFKMETGFKGAIIVTKQG